MKGGYTTMKKMKVFSLAALLIAGVAFTACSSDNDIIEEQQPVIPTQQTYTLTIKATKGENATRALAIDGSDITATWEKNDRVTVYNETKHAALDGYLKAETSGAETTMEGVFTGTVEVGDRLTLKFCSPNYNKQGGTLAYIAAFCDYATATVNVASINNVYGHVYIVPVEPTTTFTNQQAIVKFSLKNSDGSELPNNTSEVRVVVGGSKVYTITPTPASNDIFVALPAVSNQKVTLSATVGSETYVYTKTDVTFANGKYYTISPVKMQSGGQTLAETLTEAGDIVTVMYNWGYTEFTFISNGDGTYIHLSSNPSYDDSNGYYKTLGVEDGKLVFKRKYWDDNYDYLNGSVIFDTSNNTYSNQNLESFCGVTVNGNNISLTGI